MNIGDHKVGVDAPYVIAEIGSNHGGDLNEARRLIWLAADSGADAAKFQFFRGEKLYPGSFTEGAIPDEWLTLLRHECDTAAVHFICSVFCHETLDTYLRTDPVAVKIAAPEGTNYELVNAASESGVPLLISTGAMTWADLDDMPMLHHQTALLHCVSSYPAPPDQMNLNVIPRMRAEYHRHVGLSDHTMNPSVAPVAAVALGASIIEKHFTADRNAVGPDHPFALEPDEFAEMAAAVRAAWSMLGDGDKRVMDSEDAEDRR